MKLFGKKKENKLEEAPKAEEKKVATKNASKKVSTKKAIKKSAKPNNAFKKDLSYVVKNPRITEKAAILAETVNAYTFDIHKEATKSDVAQVIEKMYKVVPVKIAIAKIASKKVQVRGRRGKYGTKSGGKKAIVYLKKGDKIQLV